MEHTIQDESFDANDLKEALAYMSRKPEAEDITQYRYVLYARKSTDEEKKQIRSLPDQIAECKKMAVDLQLNIVDTFQESQSAKESEIRPIFKKIIQGFKDGKYDGIIAWHPDRLARNMKDAGEIIDLLDKKIIKDLKFKSFMFENNASGKMLLGIAFVLSKQYSDQLSDNVKRGVAHSVLEGQYINKGKHGYYKDSNQHLWPDGDNFILIQQAFEKRFQGERIKDIAKFLNDNSYKFRGKIYEMTEKRLSEILRDPFFAGVLLYGGNEPVNLMEVYDFTPAISADDFKKMNRLENLSKKNKAIQSYYGKRNTKANLLRGKVICGVCGDPFSSGLTRKQQKNNTIKNYYYYRCDNDQCTFYKKSVRAKVIVDHAIELLQNANFATEESYKKYVEQMQYIVDKKTKDLKSELNKVQQLLYQAQQEEKMIQNKLLKVTDEEVEISFETRLKEVRRDIRELEDSKKTLSQKLATTKGFILTKQDFLELFKKLPNITAKTRSMKSLDEILRSIFSNFTIDNKKVTNVSFNAPFNSFIDCAKKEEIVECSP